MLEFSDTERDKIVRLFDEFNRDDIIYVVPRGYEDLPEAVPGGDVDILVHEDDIDRAVAICESFGFENRSTFIHRYASMAKTAVSNPRQAVEFISSSPSDALKLVTLQSEQIGPNSEYKEKKRYINDFQIHFFNHLAYTSPMNGVKVRVDPLVENRMFERRQQPESGDIYHPGPVDELVHLLCRGIFDYDGEFPEYYLQRCTTLNSESESDDIRELLSEIFYDADSLVFELLMSGELNKIRDQLIRYDDY